MNNEDMIEILDDVNENENGINNPSFSGTSVSNDEFLNNNINNSSQNINYNNTNQESSIEQFNIQNIQPNEINYEPIENSKEEIKIEQESKIEESKSGLGFVIVLFIIIGAFIIALPYIAKLLR